MNENEQSAEVLAESLDRPKRRRGRPGKSDNSTERTREYRARLAKEAAIQKSHANVEGVWEANLALLQPEETAELEQIKETFEAIKAAMRGVINAVRQGRKLVDVPEDVYGVMRQFEIDWIQDPSDKFAPGIDRIEKWVAWGFNELHAFFGIHLAFSEMFRAEFLKAAAIHALNMDSKHPSLRPLLLELRTHLVGNFPIHIQDEVLKSLPLDRKSLYFGLGQRILGFLGPMSPELPSLRAGSPRGPIAGLDYPDETLAGERAVKNAAQEVDEFQAEQEPLTLAERIRRAHAVQQERLGR